VPNQPKLDRSEKLVRGTRTYGPGTTVPANGGSAAGSGSPSAGSGSADTGGPGPDPGADDDPATPPDGSTPKQRPVDPGCLDDDDLTPCIKDPLSSGGGS